MSNFVSRAGLQVDPALVEFVDTEVLTPLGHDTEVFWQDFAKLLAEFAPRNRALLARRDSLQAQIDNWHRERRGQSHDPIAYARFLEEIGYLVPDPGEFTITTENVDPEIATMAGPQLVVPVLNARFLLNAAMPAGAACMTPFMALMPSMLRLQSRVAMTRCAVRR